MLLSTLVAMKRGIPKRNGETADFEIEATPIPDAPSLSRVRVVQPHGPVRVLVSITRTGKDTQGKAVAPGAGAALRPSPRRISVGRGGG